MRLSTAVMMTLLPNLMTTAVAGAQDINMKPFVPATDFGTFRFERDRGITNGTVAGSPDSVFRVVRSMLPSLGLKIEQEDATSRQLASRKLRLLRKLADRPLSDFFSCGEGLEGPNANSWYVYVDMGVQVTPVGSNRSALMMIYTAEGVDVPGGRSDRVACASTGRLELYIIKRLRDIFPGTT